MDRKTLKKKMRTASTIVRRKLFGSKITGVPAKPEIKLALMKEWAKKRNLRTFIETGTYMGFTVDALRNDFEKIYSIELDKELHAKAVEKFKGTFRITILQGDSGMVLESLLQTIHEPCLFFLDGHYSGGETAKGDETTPVFKELSHIFKNSMKHVILIDDARLFVGEDEYPTLVELQKFVTKKNPALAFEVKDDLIRIYDPRIGVPQSSGAIRIKVTTPDPRIPFIRQTPGKKGVWENCEFLIDDASTEADWWFIMDGLPKPETVRVPRSRTVLVTSESEDMKTYDKKYLSQFGMIVTSQRQIEHPNVLYTSVHGWMVGHMGGRSGVDPKDYGKHFIPYDALKSMTSFPKEKLLSVFSSGKSRTPGQELRLAFIEALKKHFGNRIDVFGVNEKYIKDKWDGIAPYRYHISLENSHRNDYWTEKLEDAFLGGAYPFYFGAPNITDHFPKDSLTILDLNDFGAAIETIEKTMALNTYEKSQEAIIKARNLVLDYHNAFALMCRIANKKKEKLASPEAVSLFPEKKSATLPQRVARILRKTGPLYSLARAAFRKYRS